MLRLLLAEVAVIASCRYIPKALTVVFVNEDEEEETNIDSLLFRLPPVLVVATTAAVPFLGAIVILIILLTVFVMLNRIVPHTSVFCSQFGLFVFSSTPAPIFPPPSRILAAS